MYKSRSCLILGFAILLSALFGCSGGGNSPVHPDSITPEISGSIHAPTVHSNLLGYYDVYFDYEKRTFEIFENRTASFTLNIVPFLNMMMVPQYGITFGSIVIHDDDPTFLGVDVVFYVHHPFPAYEQYNAYDLMSVVIGNGNQNMLYGGLNVAEHGRDLWMNNPDGYTRWFNPIDFTSELIFGYAPGGYQNLKGTAQVNPFMYYSKHLGAKDNLWPYLTGDLNFDGFFESGAGRMMELEFPLHPYGIGLMFGYAVVVAWEEQGPNGPYYPYHRPEAIAALVDQTPDVWYNPIDGSGGSLILDVDIFGWEIQPSTIKLDSSVLGKIEEFDAAAIGMPVSDHVSTYHVEAIAMPLDTADNHHVWVIAEYEGYDYSNGLPEIPHADGPLAAFFRYPVLVLGEPGIVEPNVLTIDPNWGEVDTQLTGVTITGEFFEPTCTVMLEYSPGDTIPGDNLVWLDAETLEIDFDLNGATIGDYDVMVTNPGNLVGSLEDGFSVHHPPVVLAIDPNMGSVDDVLNATVTGNYFADGCQVELQEVEGPFIVEADSEFWVSETEITCSLTLAGAPQGYYDVVVINPDSLEGRLDDGFSVQNIIYVDDSNTSGVEDGTMTNPYNTIQEGLAAAVSAGYEDVWVDDSGVNYIGPVPLAADIYLKSENWDDSDGDDEATISVSGTSTVVNGAEGATIDGFKITGSQRTGIYINGVSTTVKNCHITSIICSTNYATFYGIRVANSPGTVIDNCEVSDIRSSNYYVICYAVHLSNSPVTMTNTKVHYIRDTGGYRGSAVVLASNCNPQGGNKLDISHCSIYDFSTGSYTTTYGLYISNCNEADVFNNLIYDITSGNYDTLYGVRISGSTDVEFVNNVIYDIYKNAYFYSGYGLFISTCTNIDVRNTIISYLHRNIHLSRAYGVYVDAASTYTFEYNDVYNCQDGNYVGNASPGTGCISANPLYVNPGTDFNLQSGSPCIDTGDPGIQDPDNSQSDMGAYGGPGGDW